MNKAILKTVGQCMYIDPTNGQVIDDLRPTVALVTAFISTKIADGFIEVITPNLPTKASDEDFKVIYDETTEGNPTEGSIGLAIAAYAATFGLDDMGGKLQGETPVVNQEDPVDPELVVKEDTKNVKNKKQEQVLNNLGKIFPNK